MEFEILGPLEVSDGIRIVDVGSVKQRRLLASLLFQPNRFVSTDRLVDNLWGDRPPRNAAAALHAYVSRLRRALEPGRLPGAKAAVVVHAPAGYMLRVSEDDIDARRFERLVEEGYQALGDGDAERAESLLGTALALWRGEVLADLHDPEFVRAESARLEQLRLGAIEESIEAWLILGRHDVVVTKAAEILGAHPYRERLRGQLMLALYRSDRQVDALRVCREGRQLLADELGLEPSPALQQLEDDILLHKSHLEWRPLPRRPRSSVSTRAASRWPPTVPSQRGVCVGREVELADLIEAWRRAVGGQRQVVVVSGDAGIGKTRLAVELGTVAARDGAIVLYGAGHLDSVVPYQPFAEALTSYAAETPPATLRDDVAHVGGTIGRLAPELARRLPGLADPVRADPETERYLLFEAAAALLERLAERAPVVVVLDDLHWADEGSWLLLAHLARHTTATRLLLLVTLRAVESAPHASMLAGLRREGLAGQLGLTGLDSQAVGDMIADRWGSPPPAEFCVAVTELSSGNPFFVEQLLARVEETAPTGDDGRPPTRLDIAVLGVPEGVRDVIGQRIGGLSTEAGQVLAIASVVGQDFRLDVIDGVTDLGVNALVDVFDEAVTAGVVVEILGSFGRYRFTHALTRETLYGGLTRTRRAYLHERVGTALENLGGGQQDRLEALAHHFLSSGLDPVKAATYAWRAATKAIGQLAHEEATILLERGLRILDGVEVGGEVRADLLLGLAEARGRAGDVNAAREALDAAADQARGVGDAQRLARAAVATRRGFLSVLPEPGETPVELLEEALAGLDPGDSVLRARVLGRLAEGLYFSAERDRGVALSRTAVDIAVRLGDDEALGHSLMSLHLMLEDPAHVEDRLEVAHDLVEVARRLGDLELDLFGRYLPVADLMEMGDVAAADAAMADCEEQLPKLRQPLLQLLPVQHRAMRAIMTGRLDEAEQLADEALELARTAGYHYAQTFGSLIFGLRWLQGRLGEIESRLARYVEREPRFPGWRAALAMTYTETGSLDEAGREFETIAANDFADCRFDHTWTTVMVTAGEVCAALGDARRAEILYRLVLPFEHRPVVLGRAVVCTGSLARTLGQLATVLRRWDDAEGHFVVADEVNHRMGAVPLIAWNQADHARMLLTRGDPGDAERAQDLLAAARVTTDELRLGGLRSKLSRLGG